MSVNETDNFAAFDLVASALEELDLHEALVRADPNGVEKVSPRSFWAEDEVFTVTPEQETLNNARGYLKDAVTRRKETRRTEDQETTPKQDEKPGGDEKYFKAYYLLAMTDYLSGKSEPAAELFKQILDARKAPETDAQRGIKIASANVNQALLAEVRYNLGAAQLEAGKTSEAITNFGIVIADSEKDSLLQLSARLGIALAHAKESSSQRAEAKKEIRKIRRLLLKDAIFLFRVGWRGALGWPGAFTIKKRKIDQQTADAFRLVLDRVRKELDSEASQTVAPAG